MKHVRIVVVGDPGVGKTSLITTLLSEEFSDNVPPTVPSVTIPPEVSAHRSFVHISDTESGGENEASTALDEADVVCLVYDVSVTSSLERVSSVWLPKLQRRPSKVPVILVGNKSDLAASVVLHDYASDQEVAVTPQQQLQLWEDAQGAVRAVFESLVVDALLCSAKGVQDVGSVFYLAQRAVLFPVGPVYCNTNKRLKLECQGVLRRIFMLSDIDGDGFLSDAEISLFQKRVFLTKLTKEDIVFLKQSIKSDLPDGVTEAGLTPDGFVSLIAQFVSAEKLDLLWAVLRCYGYGDDLKFIPAPINPPLDGENEKGSVAELSLKCVRFLQQLFTRFDTRQEGALSKAKLAELFSLSTTAHSEHAFTGFHRSVACTESNAVTEEGWLSQWRLLAFENPRDTLRQLEQLGYAYFLTKDEADLAVADNCGDASDEVGTVQNDLREAFILVPRSNIAERSIFQVYVVGARGCGKSSLLNHFLEKTAEQQQERSVVVSRSGKRTAVGVVHDDNSDFTLILREFEGVDVENLGEADLVCLLWDASATVSTFSQLLAAQKNFAQSNPKVPFVFVACKSDLPCSQQSVDVSPASACHRLGVQPPLLFSSQSTQRDIYVQLLRTIKKWTPPLSAPGGAWFKVTLWRQQVKPLPAVLLLALAVGVVLGRNNEWLRRCLARLGHGRLT